MKFIVTEDYEAMSRTAARVISGYVSSHPDCVLGLATGSTPIGLYRCLVEDYEAGALSFKDVTSFNLDEYRGLDPQHDQSYRYFMEHNLFSHVDIDPARTHVPDGACPDAAAACAAYEQSIAEAGGLGLQLLGLGHNGHIGFNEPADEFVGPTHVVELAQSTIDANKRFFASEADVPRQALTMGMAAILQARSVVVVVSGEDKAEIVHKAFFGPITPRVPASLLQLHPNVTVVGDEAAFSVLRKEGCL